ncbi:hypothetical protein C8Q78DRAFT_1065089, partial [Trametes maxima]
MSDSTNSSMRVQGWQAAMHVACLVVLLAPTSTKATADMTRGESNYRDRRSNPTIITRQTESAPCGRRTQQGSSSTSGQILPDV